MEWFVKKEDGSSFGPIEMTELREWAAEGRVAPEDQISVDQNNWSPSHENRELHMDWTIEFEDGSTYGPIHLLAFADFIDEGVIGLDSEIKNVRHDVSYALGEVLLPALVRSNINLKAIIDDIKSAPVSPREEPEQAPAPDRLETVGAPEADQPEELDKPSATIKEIAKEHKRSEKWEKLYSEETEKAEEREAELNNRLREQKNQILELTTELDEVKSKLHNFEKMQGEIEKIEKLSESEGDNKFEALKNNYRQLLESYNQISLQYDQVTNHLDEQSREIEDLREAKSSIQSSADRRIRESLDEVQREREEADKAKAKLSNIEKEHKDLLKAYRDMNDQMIRLRQQIG